MPPKKPKAHSKAQPKATGKVCDLCLQDIKDDADVLQCEGKCQSLVHRYCAGITVSHYREIETCSTPFVCVVCTQQTSKAIITQLQSEVALLKKELDELKMAAATSTALANPPNPSYASAARAGSGHRHYRGRGNADSNRRAAKPSGAEAATPTSASGESARTHTPKVKVTGARRIWGTLQECSVRSVKNALTRLCGIDNSVQVKRKTKVNPSTRRSQWWFVLHADETLLVALEEKWDSVRLQTSWKIEPCFKPAEASTEMNTLSSDSPVNKPDPHSSRNTSTTVTPTVPSMGSNRSVTKTADPPVLVQDVHNSPSDNSTPSPQVIVLSDQADSTMVHNADEDESQQTGASPFLGERPQ